MAQQIIERLISEKPNLHILSEDHAALLKSYGVDVKPGPINHAVPPEVIQYFRELVNPDHLTIETGGGYTTVALASLARRHVCVTVDRESVELTKAYMCKVGLHCERVTFIVESSDTALPKLPTGQEFDFAFIDGNHAHPFPQIDWHYIDLRLKIGGVVGLDNTEIPAVYDQCRFLEMNDSYDFIRRFTNPAYGRRYGCNFYRKVRDDHGEVFEQPYSLRPAKPSDWRDRLADWRWKRKPVWPWDK